MGEKTFFDELKELCTRRVLPSAKKGWDELKKGGRDLKNVVANRKSQMKPRVREMKTQITDSWERKGEKGAISKAAETSEEWAKKSMEKMEKKAKEWQPHVEAVVEDGKKAISQVKEKFKKK